jgi:hypothetical protein
LRCGAFAFMVGVEAATDVHLRREAAGYQTMKLSDFRNSVDGKLPNYRDVASGLDDTLVRLLIIALLPFVACMVILFTRPDLNTKFVVDSFLAAIILLAGGTALMAGLQRLEERKTGDQSTGARSLFDAGAAVLASIVVVALIYLVSRIGR